MNKFFKIYLELREQIENKQYKANSILPSENELARKYNVSRETIRKALLLLLENGYIHKIQGKGSIVLDVHRYRLPVTGILSFKERHQFQDLEAKTKVIVNEEIEAPDFLVKLGVVQPGARRAIQATENNKVLVLGTKFTTTSEVYDIEIQNINSDIVVYDKACPSFVPFIEAEGYLNREEADNIIKETLNDTIDLGMDTVVLGCTHYPMLKKNIEEFYGNRIKVISSGREAAREVSTVLGYSKLHQSKVNKTDHKFFISEKSENFNNIASKWLKQNIKAEIVEV